MPRERVAPGSNGPEKQWPRERVAQGSTGSPPAHGSPSRRSPSRRSPSWKPVAAKVFLLAGSGFLRRFPSQLPKTSETPSTTCPQRQLRMVSARMGRNGIMAYPSTPHRATISASASAAGTPLGASSASNSANGLSQGGAAIRCSHGASSSGPAGSTTSQRGLSEGDHQLEKLEFALAVALTRGDLQRSEQLRHQIDALGGNREEPGT